MTSLAGPGLVAKGFSASLPLKMAKPLGSTFTLCLSIQGLAKAPPAVSSIALNGSVSDSVFHSYSTTLNGSVSDSVFHSYSSALNGSVSDRVFHSYSSALSGFVSDRLFHSISVSSE